MCEFCGTGGPRDCAVCRANSPNLWSSPLHRPARVLIVPADDAPYTRRQELAIWVGLFAFVSYFVLVTVVIVRAG